MLTDILKLFRQAGQPLDMNELGQRLGIERSALEGMLATLVRQGRLREVTPGGEQCTRCTGKATCLHLQSGTRLGRVYELPGSENGGGK